ncbi:MAG: hypothetical protein ABDH37_07715 [Candidatus Hydrothermales bacterium]
MHSQEKIKIRENLFCLLEEEEQNFPLVEEKLREKKELIEREKLKIKKELRDFIEEMNKRKEEMIKSGILRIEEECEKIFKEGKNKAQDLILNFDNYKEEALRILEKIILKGEI